MFAYIFLFNIVIFVVSGIDPESVSSSAEIANHNRDLFSQCHSHDIPKILLQKTGQLNLELNFIDVQIEQAGNISYSQNTWWGTHPLGYNQYTDMQDA